MCVSTRHRPASFLAFVYFHHGFTSSFLSGAVVRILQLLTSVLTRGETAPGLGAEVEKGTDGRSQDLGCRIF